MRKELKQIERIENYLLDQLSNNDKIAFETELQSNQNLQSNVQLQKKVMNTIVYNGLKNSTQSAHKKYRVKKWIKTIALTSAIIGAIAVGAFQLLNKEGRMNLFSQADNPVEEVNFSQPIVFPKNDSLSANPNDYLPQEIFKINTEKDTVIESEDGVVVYIPADAFDTESKEVGLLMQTAVNTEDVILSGLSTESNGNTLETGGMFFIDAYDDTKRVGLKKELSISLPTDMKKPEMQLYQGEITADKEVNWVAPKPIENYLNLVNIKSLDFYPPGYETALDNWGLYGKEYRDSLYFSFAFDFPDLSECEKKLQINGPPQRRITPEERDFLYNDDRPINMLMTYDEALRLCSANEFSLYYDWTTYPEIASNQIFEGDPIIGEGLFNGNCASCHFPNKTMTGPALQGARQRWIDNSSEENFYEWIKNSQKVIISGNLYANELYRKWGTVMTPQPLTNQQIDHVFAYIESVSSLDEVSDDLLSNMEFAEMDSMEVGVLEEKCGINPASIEAFWTVDFNRTILATKEFEERMPWIHKSANQEVLNAYTRNLNQPIAYSDSIAITLTFGKIQEQFVTFSERNEGKTLSDKKNESLSHLIELTNYYEKRTKALTQARTNTQKSFWEKQKEADNENQKNRVMSTNRSATNERAIFTKEFELNLEKVKKELGLNKRVSDQIGLTYNVTVTTLGWKNIDQQVNEATFKRESTTFKHEESESSVTYENWEANIVNQDSYDRVNVYNIPKKINSYLRLKPKNEKYEYKLNSDIKYQTLVLAWTEKSIYFFQDKQTKPGVHSISLKPITLNEFNHNIAKSLSPIANMGSELKFIERSFKDQKRINVNKYKKRIRERIEPIIFPCRSKDGLMTMP